jgi:hypothetical protein
MRSNAAVALAIGEQDTDGGSLPVTQEAKVEYDDRV